MTNNLHRRFQEHVSGKVYSTSRLGDLTLVGHYPCNTKNEAIVLEKKIKKSKNTKRYVGGEGFKYHE